MGEIANVPSPCKNNVEGVLQRNGLSYYNALLLATGVNRPIYSGGERAGSSAPQGICSIQQHNWSMCTAKAMIGHHEQIRVWRFTALHEWKQQPRAVGPSVPIVEPVCLLFWQGQGHWPRVQLKLCPDTVPQCPNRSAQLDHVRTHRRCHPGCLRQQCL